MTCMLGPVLIAQGLHAGPRLPHPFPPRPLRPLLWGGGGQGLSLMPCDCPGGGGGVLPRLSGGRRRHGPPGAVPCGVGVNRLLLPPPPPPPSKEESATPGGRPVPTPGAGTPARATVSWREMSPKMSASPWEEEGHEATETGLAYAPVSQAHGHNHIVQCFACCTAA